MNKACQAPGYQGMIHKSAFTLVFLVLFLASIVNSHAQVTNLVARNTSIQVDMAGGTPGVSDWTVNGVSQLDQQWFYYSVAGNPLSPIDSIPLYSFNATGGNDPVLTAVYSNSTLLVKTVYTLESQPVTSWSAMLQTAVTIQNLSGSSENLQFYQYSDFDLGNTPGNQMVQFAGTGFPYNVTQMGGGLLTGKLLSISGGTVNSVEEQAGIEDGTQLGILPGNSPPTLNGNLTATGTVDFAYEFDLTLAGGGGLTISELQTVPEPSTIMLLGAGMLAGMLFYRRRITFSKQ